MPETVDWGLEDEGHGPTFEARYPGRCQGCGERFEEGDNVFYLDGELLAEGCCGDA